MKSLRVYVAGPYSKGDVAVNVRNALLAAEELVELGHVPYVPHLTHFWHCVFPHAYEFWLEFDKAWLRKCQALLRLPGVSSGADKEVALAKELSIPVYFSVEALASSCDTLGHDWIGMPSDGSRVLRKCSRCGIVHVEDGFKECDW